jgi:hypothetical protein
MLIGVVGIYLILQSSGLPALPKSADNLKTLSRDELVSNYGLEIKLVGVTALGGMIDVRFKVLDLSKAAVLFENPDQLPKLIAQDGTIISVQPENLKDLKLEQNGIVFMMFPNVNGVIQPGSEIKIIFTDFQVEGVQAQ